MKTMIMFILVSLISFAVFAQAPAQKELKFLEADGKVSFLAKGKPAMIKIIGDGSGPVGTLNLQNSKLAGTLSIDLSKLTTKIDLRDDHMKNKYLEVAKYPKAEITFKDFPFSVDQLKETAFQADLNLHGVTKPISGIVTFAKADKYTTGVAKFTFKVTDFLPELPSYAGIKVADDVEVTVDLKTIIQ
jgi:hypothetical protein